MKFGEVMNYRELGVNLLIWVFFFTFVGFIIMGARGAVMGTIAGVAFAVLDTYLPICYLSEESS